MDLFMQEMLEDLERRYPFLMRDAVDYYEIDNAELFVELKNGQKYIFDYVTKAYRRVKPIVYDTPFVDENNFKKEFGIRLRAKMQQAGFTQEMLSEKTGITQPLISRYINGSVLPNAFKLIRIAQALNYDINEFYRLPK